MQPLVAQVSAKPVKIPHGHPWRVTLMRAHKSLLTTSTPPVSYRLAEAPTRVRTWSALADDSEDLQSCEGGECVWGQYCVDDGSDGGWWQASFRDEDVLVQSAQDGVYVIPYVDMRRIELPEKKSPAMETTSGILYDESTIEGFSGKLYSVRAAAWASKNGGIAVWRNIYYWHAIVLATYHDRKREGLQQEKGWRD